MPLNKEDKPNQKQQHDEYERRINGPPTRIRRDLWMEIDSFYLLGF